ncbi:hypothetical protein HPB49_006254 [Dermacentor silvarum]|uniref:Uncharacterized protein n=1 Tax=Dermacentor silvarum TaxID=543639 RepID=A0ACB8DW87_DERSI|nr:hypothetical protein HPB49_006254 [Dermacentor silvarum]
MFKISTSGHPYVYQWERRCRSGTQTRAHPAALDCYSCLWSYCSSLNRLCPKLMPVTKISADLRWSTTLFTARSMDHTMGCTQDLGPSADGVCHVVAQLSTWNEVFVIINMELCEAPPGKLSLGCLREISGSCGLAAFERHVTILLHWLLTVHRVQEMAAEPCADRASAMIREATRWLLGIGPFMKMAGVVKNDLSWDESVDYRERLQTLALDCWLHVRQFIKVRDVLHWAPSTSTWRIGPSGEPLRVHVGSCKLPRLQS